MALDLYMLGLIVENMGKALEFYRRLGFEIPEGSEKRSHVQIKMESGLTLFLDSNPTRWDPHFVRGSNPQMDASHVKTVLEFYFPSREAVDEKYAEMISSGYTSHAVPYDNGFGMYFAMIYDPDGNTILLSADA